jgi:Ca2+-binding EF-hand superfamily protein
LAEAKYKNYEELLGRMPSPKLAAPPLQQQTLYYRSTERDLKLHETKAKPKTSLFKGFGEAVLQGGVCEPYLPSAYKKTSEHARRRSSVETEPTQDKEKGAVSKEVEHKKASTETQLVHVLHGKTLEGQVDIRKIVDIRRTIRRRYANRTEIAKIFSAWDLGSLGVIRAEDVHMMVNRLGIELNQDEAKVLVATANKSLTGCLSLDEFMQLIFDESDQLNMDLTSLADPSIHQVPEKFLGTLQELAVNPHTQRLLNTLIFEVKEHLSDVNASLVKGDRRKKGVVSFETFCDVLNNLALPHSFSNAKYWRMLYTEMGGTYKGLSTSNFYTQIQDLQISEDARISTSPAERVTSPVISRTPLQPRGGLLDRRRLPINMLEKVMRTLVPLKALIVEKYPTPGELRTALEGIAEGPGISSAKLAVFLQQVKPGVFLSDSNLFLSAFSYNPSGLTDVTGIVRQVFALENQGNIELHRHKRVLAPLAKPLALDCSASTSSLLRTLDQKINWGARSYEAFKRIDLDGDGFVSTDDLMGSLKLMNLAVNEGEAAALMKEIDAGHEGHLTYQKFAKQMSTPLMEKSKAIWDTREINVQPSTTFLQTLQSQSRYSQDFFETVRQSLKPNLVGLTASTRYSASPKHKNTFGNFKS